MNRLSILALVLGIMSTAMGEVSVRVCLADGNTPLQPADPNIPFVYREITVGTRLTIIVSSDATAEWNGCLAISDAYMDYGVLSGRDYNDVTLDWEGSHTEAAGNEAAVLDWVQTGSEGFDLYSGWHGVEAGDWFIIDYTAANVGVCNVGFYYFDEILMRVILIRYLTFSHILTQDFNIDTKVDFGDFALFASPWKETDCNDPYWCEGVDLDTDGDVDVDDLILFADYWLERTE